MHVLGEGETVLKEKRIALLGTRGIPARYGGFETFAEEISARLVLRGYDVTVFGRKRFFEKHQGPVEHRGAKIIVTSTIMHKYLETPVHSITSFWQILFSRYDAILLCNAANSPFAFIANLKGIPLLINVDGIERNRAKWNMLGKLWYKLGERCSVWFANRVIADADVIKEYYREAFQKETTVIPYGVHPEKREAGDTLSRFNLKAREYILYVSRLEPENNALGVIEAYKKITTTLPLVIVGDAPYADEYKQQLRTVADERVVFTGFQFGEAYQELQSNCILYIQATEVGGTHPALIESMSYGNCVVANGTPENTEVLGDAGEIYRKNDFDHLTEIVSGLLANPERRKKLGAKAEERALRKYSWDSVVGMYEEVFKEVMV